MGFWRTGFLDLEGVSSVPEKGMDSYSSPWPDPRSLDTISIPFIDTKSITYNNKRN